MNKQELTDAVEADTGLSKTAAGESIQAVLGVITRVVSDGGSVQLETKLTTVFQRRHDCIHCCDRPKSAIQTINLAAVQKKIEDVEFLVNRCHAELSAQFGDYLTGLGFSGATRNQVMA